MKASRIASITLLFVILVAPPAGAASLDYTAYWAHLVDPELHHFLYDCGGAVESHWSRCSAYAHAASHARLGAGHQR